MSIGNRRFEEGGLTYVWFGGFGAVVKSFERGVAVGDLRVIAGETLYAYMVYPRGWLRRRSEVSWTFLEPTIENIRQFQRHVFGVADAD